MLDTIWKLRVGDKKCGDMSLVKQTQHLVDFRIHNGFTNERQCTVTNRHGFLCSLGFHTFDSTKLFDHTSVFLDRLVHDSTRFVLFPSPLSSHRILVMTPTERTLVRTRKTRCCFHTLIARNTVACVFVTTSPATQLMFCPSTKFHCTVCSDDLVSSFVNALRCFGVTISRGVSLFSSNSFCF